MPAQNPPDTPPTACSTSVHFGNDDPREQRRLERRDTAKKMQDKLANPKSANDTSPPAVPPKLWSPIHILSVLSLFLSIAIFVCAVIWKDGAAILAISLISLASSGVGYASFWAPLLMNRKSQNEVPKGDVMIHTREGASILIRCTEEVARELYSGTEECKYNVNGRTYRLLMALGTRLLMLSVVILGNCIWNSQIFIGASYIVLNGLYWGLGMVPRSAFWDLSRYTWKFQTPRDAMNAHEITNQADECEGHPSFTRTLWYAIRETGRVGWVERSGAAPETKQWKKWLTEARKNAKGGTRDWRAVAKKNSIMEEHKDEKDSDEAAQRAPVSEVQAISNVNPIRTQDNSF